MCVSEGERARTLVESTILQMTGDKDAARRRVLESMGYLWGTPEALEILSATQPAADQNTYMFHIEILGGLASFGYFTQFSEEHIGTFDVLANSEEEALGYIDEVANFANPSAKLIIASTKSKIEPSPNTHRGVCKTYPFRVEKVN